jgi:hypothetical protein
MAAMKGQEMTMFIRKVTAAFVVSSLLLTSPVMAQSHVVDQAALGKAVADKAAIDQQNRDEVRGFLNRAEVREVAARLGLDVTRAETAVSTLSSDEAADLADQARQVDAQLAGGDSITISVTTLLLVIIIIILLVALD